MKRMLAQILIFSLLVIAPVSFSTESIPSFDVPATKTSRIQESKKNNITIAHRVAQTLTLNVIVHPLEKCNMSLPALPAIETIYEIEHGRAPPETLPA